MPTKSHGDGQRAGYLLGTLRTPETALRECNTLIFTKE
jgi:hypothetical protein